MLWERVRARPVAKTRPIKASGPLLTHHLPPFKSKLTSQNGHSEISPGFHWEFPEMFLGGEDSILDRAPERRAEILSAPTCKWQRPSLYSA